MLQARKWVTNGNVMLLAIVALGASLRFYRLGVRGLTWDETFSYWASSMSLPELLRAMASDTHPPLYFLLLHYWMSVVGTSEWALQLLSALFGILAIPAIYLVGREFFDKEVGLIAALLLSVSAFNVDYSQEARMYSLMVLLALLSMFFFARMLRQEQWGISAITVGYVASTTLLLYTHLYGLLIVVAQNAYLLALLIIRKRYSVLRRWAVLQAAVVVLFIPWVPVMLNVAARKGVSGFWIPRPAFLTLADTFTYYTGEHFKHNYYVLACIFVALSVLALISYRRTSRSHASRTRTGRFWDRAWKLRLHVTGPICLLVIWIVVINAIPFVASFFLTPFYYFKYTIAASAALYLLVAKGVKNVSNSYAKLATIGVIVVLCSTSVLAFYHAPLHNEGRDPRAIVTQNAQPGDLILAAQWQWGDYYPIFWNYYLRGTAADVQMYTAYGNTTQQIQELHASTHGYDRVWFIAAPNATTRNLKMASTEKLVQETLNGSYNATCFHCKVYDVYLFEKRSS